MDLAAGQILGGKYRVERLLGRGGMGVVFAATHLELDELVAIKLLRDDGGSQTAAARFQREARAAVRLRGQHVARVLDVDRLPDGQRYMVMEHLEGDDLSRILRKRERLPVAEAASYILQACEGLAEAHALGMVHRDIKLQNLFVTERPDGTPLLKVLDFGIVKLNRQLGEKKDEASLTQPSMIIGSVRYMAPEQLQASDDVDARADIWALGVSLYALLAGKLPFAEEHVGALYAAITTRAATRLDRVSSDVPSPLADVVERAMQKDPARRFATVAELAAGLEPFTSETGAATRIAGVLRVQSARASSASLPQIEEPDLTLDDSGTTLSMEEPTASLAPTKTEEPVGGDTLDHVALGSATSSARSPILRRRWPLVAGGVGLVIVVRLLFFRSRSDEAAPPSPPPIVAAADRVPDAAAVIEIESPPEPPIALTRTPDPIAKPATSSGRRPHRPTPSAKPPISAYDLY